MSSTRHTILQALRDIRLVDPHSHINPYAPASKTLADILGYHYYTELAHSAGMPKSQIEEPGIEPRELVRRLVGGLGNLTNTAQHAWLIDICQRFFGFQGDVIDESNWESIYDAAEAKMQMADWSDSVLEHSNVEAVFLTNDFDDSLQGFNTNVYVPCLRTDDLVFHLSKSEVRARLETCTNLELRDLGSLRDSLEQRFEHFVSHGARACAISLPPDFSPTPVTDGRAATALSAILRLGNSADASHRQAIAKRVFWTIVELCDQFNLPMDLMIGVNRGVYAEGVYQGRDLYDSRVSLTQYRELFNAFPNVMFPISVLASVTNQELVSHAWIFPNVLTNGHWWYSNTPSFIHRDASARLEAVPRNKQIGYYSDAYKLEFIAPKFDMYRQILAKILTDDFVVQRGWSEEKAIQLGWQVLRGNVDTIFPGRHPVQPSSHDEASPHDEPSQASALALGSIPALVTGLEVVDEAPESLALASTEAFTGASTADADNGEAAGTDEDAASEIEGGFMDHSTIVEWAPAEDASMEDLNVDFASLDEESSSSPQPSLQLLAENDSDFIEEPIELRLRHTEGGEEDFQETLPLDSQLGLADEAAVTNSLDPHSTIDFVPDAFDQDQGPVSPRADHDEEIHYFRADDMGMSAEDLMHLESTDPPAHRGLVADPVTGEPTWPVEESTAEEAGLEETYLLHDDMTEVDDSASLDIANLDDLELLPMDDVQVVEPESEGTSGQDFADDQLLEFDIEPTFDLEDDEPK